jgi:hypothetical protein
MTTDMTVITCGDSAAGQLRAAGLAGDVIVWRDILHEGPVPGGLDLDELSAVRAGHIASMGWAEHDATLRDFLDRNARLRAAAAGGRVVLWFDDNLVNQLQLLQVLTELAYLDPLEVQLAGPRTFGGASAGQLRRLADEREPVGQSHFDRAATAWAAFTAEAPAALAGLAAAEGRNGRLPALATAIGRHLRQFPSTRDGLGLTERRGLAAIADGHTQFTDIFVAHAAADDPPFMGDTTFRHYLDRLARGPRPLIRTDGDGHYQLTDAGASVLDGVADQIELNGIDRWYGGVHLDGRATWRWDDEQEQLVAAS